MKKIIETVAEGGGELGVHMYPYNIQFYYVAGIGRGSQQKLLRRQELVRAKAFAGNVECRYIVWM
jgi:hypothetical protein